MTIDHPLWNSSILQLKSRFMSKSDMCREVRTYIEGKRRCDDLTANEIGFNAALEQWLIEQEKA